VTKSSTQFFKAMLKIPFLHSPKTKNTETFSLKVGRERTTLLILPLSLPLPSSPAYVFHHPISSISKEDLSLPQRLVQSSQVELSIPIEVQFLGFEEENEIPLKEEDILPYLESLSEGGFISVAPLHHQGPVQVRTFLS
jgi:hypothetical protein